LPRIIHLAANSRLWGDNQAADGKDRAWSNQPTDVLELAAYERLANGFAVLFTNRGAPLIYYGDEIGMAGAGDPDNRRFMQWGTLNSNQQYLHDRLKKLLDIRSKHPALRRGVRTTLEVSTDVWAYSRVTSGDTVYVAVNRGDTDQNINSLPAGSYSELVTGGTATGPQATIPARQTRIYVAN
jgi:glycosidase